MEVVTLGMKLEPWPDAFFSSDLLINHLKSRSDWPQVHMTDDDAKTLHEMNALVKSQYWQASNRIFEGSVMAADHSVDDAATHSPKVDEVKECPCQLTLHS